MIVTSLDQAPFQKAFRQIMATTQRTLTEEMNYHAFFIARGASREIPVSKKVESDVGVVGYSIVNSRKTGKTKKGKAIFSINTGNRFAAIINARRAKAGEAAVPKAQMADKIRKLIAARLRSKGTEKAGLLAAIRKLGRILGIPSYAPDRVTVTHPSLTQPAKEGWNPECSIEYRIISTDTNRKEYIDPATVAAVQKAFDDETASMVNKISQRLQRGFNGQTP